MFCELENRGLPTLSHGARANNRKIKKGCKKILDVDKFSQKSSSLSLNTTSQTTTVAPFLAWRGWWRNAHLSQTAEGDTTAIAFIL